MFAKNNNFVNLEFIKTLSKEKTLYIKEEKDA